MPLVTVDLSEVDGATNEAYAQYYSDFRRFQVFKGGAGAGKSVFAAQKIVYNVLFRAGYNVLALRKVGVDNRNSTYAEVKKCINSWDLGALFDCTVSPLEIRCKVNHNKVVFFGLDDVEKRKSLTFETGDLVCVWVEEASEITHDDFMQLNLRLRGIGDIPKHMILTFNPIDIDSWLKCEFWDTPLSVRDGFVCETTYKDNAYIDERYKEELESYKLKDEYYYDVYVRNMWGQRTTTTVFHNLVIEDFEFVESDFSNRRFGMDFGWEHATALEGVGFKDGELYIWFELYGKRTQNAEFVAQAKERGLPEQYTIKADSAEPDKIAEWRNGGFTCCFPTEKYPGSVKREVDYLAALPKIHIHKTLCPNAAREFPRFRRRQLKSGLILDNEFVELEDDTIAAVRYACDDFVLDAQKAHYFMKRGRE